MHFLHRCCCIGFLLTNVLLSTPNVSVDRDFCIDHRMSHCVTFPSFSLLTFFSLEHLTLVDRGFVTFYSTNHSCSLV